MTFDVKFSATINLKIDDIKKIITEAAEAQMPTHRVTRVDFKVGVTRDDRMDSPGYSPQELTGCDVVMVPKRQQDEGFVVR